MKFICLSLVLLSLAWITTAYRNVCYYGSWSVYRYGRGKFIVENIDPNICSHIIFTFVGLSDDGSVRLLDAWNDEGDEWHEGAFTKMRKLRDINPDVKLLLAVGGWNEGSERYSKVLGDSAKRAIFIDSAINMVTKHDFDGFDLDWEYPTQRGGVPADKTTFTQLIQEMRSRFDAKNYVLSAAVSCNPAVVDESYDVPQLSKYLHFINVMTYDIHGSWDGRTGHNAPLLGSQKELSETGTSLNVKSSIEHWIARGADPKNLNMGLATYGRSFTLSDASNYGVWAASSGAGTAGNFVDEAGFLGYNEICYEQGQNLWSNYRDEEQRVPYAVKGTKWVGFDDPESITEKVKVLKQLGLGGSMFWSVETDDFDNICGKGKYPLINAAVRELGGINSDPSNPQTTSAPPQTTAPETTAPPQTTSAPTTSAPTTSAPTTSAPTTSAPTTSAPTTSAPTTSPPQTTTQKPSGGTFDPNAECGKSTSGYIRHPTICSKFYQCQLLAGNQYRAHEFNCASGLGFDLALSTCNYLDQIQC